MENSEIFVLLGKILAKIEQLEKHMVEIERKLIPNVNNINREVNITRDKTRISPGQNIKEEIERIRRQHMTNAKPPVDLSGVPSLPDLSYLKGMAASIKGSIGSLSNSDVLNVQEIKETKDEESNK